MARAEASVAQGEQAGAASCRELMCRRKSADEIRAEAAADANEKGPKLRLFDLLCIGIGTTVGSGVFILTNDVLPIAGPSAVLSWLLAAMACLLSAFSYIELSARIPTSGSCYAYSHHALGELCAVIGALCLTMEYGISGAGVARSWSKLVATLFKLEDDMFLWYPGADRSSSDDLYFDLPAGLIMLVCVVVTSAGVSLGRVVINFFTAMKVALVLFLIVAGLCAWHIDIFESQDAFFPTGLGGTMKGVSALFFGFVGFDEVCCLAGKSENPTYTMPRALAGTLLGAAVLSMLAQLALSGMMPFDAGKEWPQAFDQVGWQWAGLLTNIGEVVLLPLVVLVSFLPQPELLGAMAHDGLIPSIFAKKDATGTYVKGAIISGAVMVVIAAAVPFQVLWDMISLSVLLSFNLTNTSLVMIRFGNGGELRAPRLTYLVAGFWLTGALGAYSLSKGVLLPAMDGHQVWPWASVTSSAAFVCAGALLLAISRQDPYVETGDDQLFKVPLVPFVPGIAILLNFTLMAMLSWSDHLYLLVCILASLGVYAVKGWRRAAAPATAESPHEDSKAAAKVHV